ncbi:MAG: NADH:ubiquinone oxidoreductase, subunit RnfA [Oscillospiraceae bacterium]|nr:NADH:ubiquinone oxidoreductase, subunit RnfA [Oscillospiraceae bacterium]
MSIVIGGLAEFFLYAVAAFAAQNAVFGRSLGITRLVQMVEDPDLGSVMFCVLLTLVQLLCAPLCWAANLALSGVSFRPVLRPVVFLFIAWVVVELVGFVCRKGIKGPRGEALAAQLPAAAYNTCVLGTLLICTVQNFNLAQHLGFALGSGVGYMASVLLVVEGQRKLSRRSVPAAFRGLPIMLIYIGILALAVYGFTGHSLAI